tara:strand:- start:1243 stop:1875 length:633 start_codon:yes stop_codon:yes gene_type:complete
MNLTLNMEYNYYCIKHGEKYSAKHVNYLYTNLPNLTCLTDNPKDIHKNVNVLPLPDFDLEKWWYKMCFFSTELFPEPGIFLDLDLEFLRHLNGKLEKDNPYMRLFKCDWENLEELNVNTIGNRYKYCSINSSVMAWDKSTDRDFIWNDFINNKDKIVKLFHGIDPYLEHRHLDKLSFYESGIMSSNRCRPNAEVYIMSYDGEDKDVLTYL